jgi:hypothetical protein
MPVFKIKIKIKFFRSQNFRTARPVLIHLPTAA